MGKPKESKVLDLIAVFILSAGIVAIGMILYSQRLVAQIFDQQIALISLSKAVQQDLTSAYRWFDVVLSADRSVDYADVYHNIDEAIDRVNASLEGGRTEFAEVRPVQDSSTRSLMLQLRQSLFRLREITSERLKRYRTGQEVGDAENKAYDAEFRKVMALSKSAEAEVRKQIARDRKIISWIHNGILLFFLFLFGAMAWIVVRNKRAIQAKNRDLETRVQERTSQLVESEAHTRAILEAAFNGIISFNEAGNIQSFNAWPKEFLATRAAKRSV